jgi:hypothetical protein
MRVLVIPDIHGETFWKEPVQKYIDQVDKIVFLGDYLDPYRQFEDEYSPDTVFNNMMDIVNLKLINKDKVVLLKGNHDFHYTSKRAMELACASRCDKRNWHKFNNLFNDYDDLFKLAHLESIKGITYLFSHAGITTYWINKVNAKLWKMNDRDVSIDNQDIIDKINDLEYDLEGQNMLAIIGEYRTIIGEKTGSILWADIEEHTFPVAPKAYGLDKVFQVFGHSRLDSNKADMIVFENIALIDSEQCFMIDDSIKEKIMTIKEYGRN